MHNQNSSFLGFLKFMAAETYKVGSFFGFLLLLIYLALKFAGATFFITTSQEMKDKLNPVWQEQFEKGIKEKSGVNAKIN